MAARVAIFGGGVSGLSAAQELLERGFEVTLFERRRDAVGGKSRAEDVPGSARDGSRPLPGEHGFRFFPGFYHHLDDIMRRIPFPGNPAGVYGNLVSCDGGIFAPMGRPCFRTPVKLPTSLEELRILPGIPQRMESFGITADDLRFFFERFWRFATSCDERRLVEHEHLSWWDFTGAAQRSTLYQSFFATGQTQNLVACRSQESSTRTMGTIMIQLLMNMTTPGRAADRVLNGPTNEAWLEPWLAHLRHLGLVYQPGAELQALNFHAQRIEGAAVSIEGRRRDVIADYYLSALPVEVLAKLVTPSMLRKDPSLQGLSALAASTRWMNGLQYYLDAPLPLGFSGHAHCFGAPWALTAIAVEKVWRRMDWRSLGDGSIRDILTVDLSDWDTPGFVEGPSRGKRARDCTREEVIAETWYQLRRSLCGAQGQPLLGEYRACHLDSSIQVGKDGKLINREPLLINRIGMWSLRPEAKTQIPNLLLAGDFVKTNTDLISMEGANESARRAVNAILEAEQHHSPRCRLFRYREPLALAPLRQLDALRWRRGLPQAPVSKGSTPALARVSPGGAARSATARPWLCEQRWQRLLFASWSVAPEALRALVPDSLALELFEGMAWVTLVPMFTAEFSAPLLGRLPVVGGFPQMNLRTYVRHNGAAGIYFLRIDCEARLARFGASRFFDLPYREARVSLVSEGARHHFSSEGSQGSLRASYTQGRALKGSPLSAFLTERYSSFSTRGGRVLRLDTAHAPWSLREASLALEENTIWEGLGLGLSKRPNAAYFGEETTARCWLPTSL